MNAALWHASLNGDKAEIRHLIIEEECDVNVRSYTGRTPLHMAAIGEQSEAMELLLELGADPTIRDKKGQTAYDITRTIHAARELKKSLEDGPSP